MVSYEQAIVVMGEVISDVVNNHSPYSFSVIEGTLVGSTLHNGKGNDVDVLLHVSGKDRIIKSLVDDGWKNESEGSNYPDGFSSLRKGNINLILSSNKGFYDRMSRAAEVVKAVVEHTGIEINRALVCNIYSMILYGEWVEK